MKRILFLLIFICTPAISAVFSSSEIHTLKAHFFSNIKPNGAIVASPSQTNPNYYYDWIRDSAMAMGLIENWYEADHATPHKQLLYHYVTWSETLQSQYDPLPGQDILGEPKFYIDGSLFTGSWGRPQNDGPALRAMVLTRFAHQLLNKKKGQYVQKHLYNASLDAQSMGVIKKDLEYVAHHWQEVNFDLWEEVLGNHFFTAMVQQKALIDGAALARRLNDNYAASFYEAQAQLITSRLKQHIDTTHHLIQATLVPHSGPQKTLELDTSIILGVLLNQQKNSVFQPGNTYVKNTIHALHEEFNSAFPINENAPGAILFGRYPGDTYDGYQGNSRGNPWFILTATMAEYYYTLADSLSLSQEHKPLIRKYLTLGDKYLQLVKKYAPGLYISEQINLDTGAQQGAASLTWSYVAILRANDLREKLVSKLRGQ